MRLNAGPQLDLTAAHENFVEAYRLVASALPGGDVLELPGGCALSTGQQEPEFNRAFVIDAAADMVSTLSEFRAFYLEKRLPWMLIASSEAAPAVDRAAAGTGLVPGRIMPGMVMDPIAGVPTLVPGLVIEQVTSAALGEIFAAVLAEGFGTSPELARTFVAPGAIDADGVAHYIGWLDDQPVATATCVVTDRVAGLYNIATVRAARRRGVGEAMTWVSLLGGQDEGCDRSALQSTVQGFSVYRRMGYAHVTDYRSWYWLDR